MDEGLEGPDTATGSEGTLTLLSRDELESMVRSRTEALNNVMDTMADLLLTLDRHGRVTMANEALSTILGYRPEDIEGKPIDQLLAHPDEMDDADEYVGRGEFVSVLLREGKVMDAEVACSSTDGEIIPMSLSASVMRDGDGGVTGIVCVAKDISDRKAAEKKAEFLHSLLRHDVGNKLQIVDGYLDILGDGALDPDQEEFLKRCEEGVDEALELLEKVRMLNRLDADQIRRVTLTKPITEAIDRNAGLANREGFEIVPPEDAAIRVQGGLLLKELFANLIENAIKHSEGSHIEFSVDERDDEVVVGVEDDGIGVPDEKKDRIVERGYSGAGSGGSGLGTHLAQQLSETYGGSLAVEDSALGGARFAVTLQK